MAEDPTNDTDPRIEEIRIEAYRRMTPSEKMAIVSGLNRMVFELAAADVRRNHPNADEREVQLRVASRHLDPDLLFRATGWDVRVQGY